MKQTEQDDLDAHERRMANYTPGDIMSMTDEEVMRCANLVVEGEPTRGIALSGTYFASKEQAARVAVTVVDRARIAHERAGDIIPRQAAYISVDGTIIDKHLKPVPYLHEFVDYLTQHYVCFWLTERVRDGNRGPLFDALWEYGVPKETIDLLTGIWPTHWEFLKTEAINFRGDFIWFEDMPTEGELAVLEKFGQTKGLYQFDRAKGDGLKKWLQSVGALQ